MYLYKLLQSLQDNLQHFWEAFLKVRVPIGSCFLVQFIATHMANIPLSRKYSESHMNLTSMLFVELQHSNKSPCLFSLLIHKIHDVQLSAGFAN